MDFEWDDDKAEANERKHGVSFAEAETVFADQLALTGYDPDHSDEEDRYLTMGTSIDVKRSISNNQRSQGESKRAE